MCGAYGGTRTDLRERLLQTGERPVGRTNYSLCTFFSDTVQLEVRTVRSWVASCRTVGCFAALVVAATLWFGASPAWAQGSGYYVTFVARSCPSYADIFANRARNNIVESLEDLGPDTQYPVSGGVLIDPVHEDIPPQTNCSPLVGWQFTLGTSYQSRVVTGVWGSLSRVTGAYDTSIVTQASTPLLDTTAQEVPGQTIAGATTIELTDAQRAQASASSQLWAQGGTPDDPVLVVPFPGPQYGFGTLRCATDNLNGDNVEFIYFPEGVTHVFCYAYYVKPPPTTGIITIKKQVIGAPAASPSFLFNGTNPGNLSFDPNGFTLADGQSTDFFRAGGVSWNVAESPVDNYETSISCVNADGSPATNVAVSGRTVTIDLVALQHVTCTYTNTYVPPPGGLTITKVTHGGVGTFTYDVTPVSGQGGVQHATATTTVEGVPVDATPSLTSLAPGTYRIAERRPTTPDGRWRLTSVTCDGRAQSATGPFEVTITSGQQVSCQFTNRFTPKGAISLSKITEGATGKVVFQVERASTIPAQYVQTATTTRPGVAADAVPETPADATDRLRLGTYRVTEQAPPGADAEGWTLTLVTCNGVVMSFEQGSLLISLTRSEPRVRCVFTDTFTSKPPPEPGPESPEPPPPDPDVPPGITPDEPASPWSDLAVSKTAAPGVVTVGSVVTYRITVTNHGPDDAVRVVLSDKLPAGTTAVSVHSDVGRCRAGPPVACDLGTLKPGAKVAVILRVHVSRQSARLTNRAVAGTDTYDPVQTNNVADASVRVVAPPPPSTVTG